MKIIDEITLVLFSIIILTVSLIMGLLIFGWFDPYTITMWYEQITSNPVTANVTLGVLAVCLLLAFRAIFFRTSSSTSSGDGVLLQNEAGKLLISKDTIENLVNSVAKGFENTQSVTTKVMINSDNELKVIVTLMVLPNTAINELSMNLQTRVKEVVKKVADLEIKTIDIKIKNITTPEEKTQN